MKELQESKHTGLHISSEALNKTDTRVQWRKESWVFCGSRERCNLKQVICRETTLPRGHTRSNTGMHTPEPASASPWESKGAIRACLACHPCLQQPPDVRSCNQTLHVRQVARQPALRVPLGGKEASVSGSWTCLRAGVCGTRCTPPPTTCRRLGRHGKPVCVLTPPSQEART